MRSQEKRFKEGGEKTMRSKTFGSSPFWYSDSCYKPSQFLDMTVNRISKATPIKIWIEYYQLARWRILIIFSYLFHFPCPFFCAFFWWWFDGLPLFLLNASKWPMLPYPCRHCPDRRASISQIQRLFSSVNLCNSIPVPDVVMHLRLIGHCRLAWLGTSTFIHFYTARKIIVSAGNCLVRGKLREWLLINAPVNNWGMILSSICIESVPHLSW